MTSTRCCIALPSDFAGADPWRTWCIDVHPDLSIHGIVARRRVCKSRPCKHLRLTRAGLSSRRSRVRVPSLPPSFNARCCPISRHVAHLRPRAPRPSRALPFGSGVQRRAPSCADKSKVSDIVTRDTPGDQGSPLRAEGEKAASVSGGLLTGRPAQGVRGILEVVRHTSRLVS